MDVAVWHVLPNDLVRRFAKELQIDEVSRRGNKTEVVLSCLRRRRVYFVSELVSWDTVLNHLGRGFNFEHFLLIT